MKSNVIFDFKTDKKTNSILVKRSFNANLALVWDAWTKAEILDRWWAPEGYRSTTKSLNFVEGGMRHYRMQGPNNFEMWGITTYDKISYHKNYSGKEYSADEFAKVSTELPPSVYLIRFYKQKELTLIEHMTTYNSLNDLEQSLQYGFEEGMLGAFDRLDSFLDK
ncbi:SRPBCC domain-containing protein [uncultured Croceitalea sp.]|uniref:SRPBCC family protein n=1 Tax=uncultured Croceitalea sp. TaxID=1798908 RepID=UPI0033062D49